MKSKIIILFGMLLLLTGCDAVYKLDYSNDIFKESLDIINWSSYKDEIKSVYSFDLSTNYYNESDYTKEDGLANGYTYYSKSLDENNLILNYSYEFKKEEYKNSQIAKNVFPKFSFNGENRIYSNNIGDIYIKYPNLGNITIELTTDKTVGYNTADKVLNNTYYWYITKENSDSKIIEVIFAQDEKNIFEKIEEYGKNNEDLSNFNWNIIFVILGGILLVLIIFVFVKVKNSNKK